MNCESRYNHYITHDGKKVIYNSLSKSSITVNENFDLKKIISYGDKEIINVLKKQGMIVESAINELEFLKYLFNKNFFDSNSFLNIVLVPGLDCNFKCPYCFEKVKGTENLFKTNLKTYFSVLRRFAEKHLEKYKSIEISLFGGEPLLFAKDIFKFFEYVKKTLPQVSCCSSIVTNGSLLDSKMVNKLTAYNCRSIQVTLDGCKNIHDKNRIFKDGRETYELLIQNINSVVPELPEDCQFNLRINLNNVTVDEVETTLLDIDPKVRKKIKLLFRPIYNTGEFKQDNSNKFYELKPYLDIAKNYGFDIVRNTYYYQACESCSGDNFFFIMPDLSIWKCINDLSFDDAKIGRITCEGELEFEAEKLVNWYKYSDCFQDEKCLECKKLPDCLGGCVLYRAKNGNRSCKEFEMSALPYLY